VALLATIGLSAHELGQIRQGAVDDKAEQRTVMTVLGDVVLNADGLLDGWCWNPDAPNARCTVEILIDEEIIHSVVASRPRDDLKFLKYGDGNHGFVATLTRQIAKASKRSAIRARDHASGHCFWQKPLGEFMLPDGFDDRLAGTRAMLDRLAHSPALRQGRRKAGGAVLNDNLARLGERLVGPADQPALPAPARHFTLAALPEPSLSVIFDAGAEGAGALHAIRCAAHALGQANAEAILTDAGADPQTLRLQAQAGQLKYIFNPGAALATRRNQAVAMARGGIVLFVGLGDTRLDDALAALPALAADGLVISRGLADAARRVAPQDCESLEDAAVPAPENFILAAPRALFTRHGGFDPDMDDGAGLDLLDWTLRAARAGQKLTAWHAPWSTPRPLPAAAPAAPDLEAGHRFAARWVMGTA
jgi:hypothetical protein